LLGLSAGRAEWIKKSIARVIKRDATGVAPTAIYFD
jgi:hypothetical protein